MKKTLLLISLILSLQSQGQTYLDENFEDTVGTGDWTIWDYDGDGNYWQLVAGIGHSGNSFVSSYSKLNNTALTPDNFVVTPMLIVTSEYDSLSYWIAIGDNEYPVEHYAVLVSTTGRNFDDFTTSLFEETLSANNLFWKRRAFSLSQFEGQSIYIAFRHYNCTNNSMIQLDDVKGPQIYNGSANLSETASISVKVFPSPAKDVVHVEAGEQLYSYKVLNMIGEELIYSKINEKSFFVDTQNLGSGIYLLQMEFETGFKTHPFVIE